MKQLLLALCLCAPAFALDIAITNDDGFESSTIHALKSKLIAAGHRTIICSNTLDNSGKGGAIDFLKPLTLTEKDSRGGMLKAGSPAIGQMTGDPGVFYIDSTPATAVLYCLDIASFKTWQKQPDLVISGPNYGRNTGLVTNNSGTYQAGIMSVNRGIPALMVSATTPRTYKTFEKLTLQDPEYEDADIVVQIVKTLTPNSGAFLPQGLGININIPDFKSGEGTKLPYFFSQIGTATNVIPFFTEDLSQDALGKVYNIKTPAPGVTAQVSGRNKMPDRLSRLQDTNADSEENASNAGYITLSIVNGTASSTPQQQEVIRLKLKSLVK